MTTIDRIQLAAKLSAGKRVLDIGGQKMEGCDPESAFAKVYERIEQESGEYRIVDYQKQATVDYVIDFNNPESINHVHNVIKDYQPDVILCMEILEHVNYRNELMNELAYALREGAEAVFITIPNNGNWIFNALGWNVDHSVAFFRDIAYRFISRSDLGAHHILVAPCMQKYLWYWRIVYILSFFQPFSWGFLITSDAYLPSSGMTRMIAQLNKYTSSLLVSNKQNEYQ